MSTAIQSQTRERHLRHPEETLNTGRTSTQKDSKGGKVAKWGCKFLTCPGRDVWVRMGYASEVCFAQCEDFKAAACSEGMLCLSWTSHPYWTRSKKYKPIWCPTWPRGQKNMFAWSIMVDQILRYLKYWTQETWDKAVFCGNPCKTNTFS